MGCILGLGFLIQAGASALLAYTVQESIPQAHTLIQKCQNAYIYIYIHYINIY